ncbi:MAG: hypothetical protein M1817_001093 [Caeruleum heppii]|nr:MAG: hypothetical protein M1817_001093 [Caeruleum heppii]
MRTSDVVPVVRAFRTPGNYTLLQTAIPAVVINESRKDVSRLLILNTVSPFKNAWQFLPDVPYAIAKQVNGILNGGPVLRRELDLNEFNFNPMTIQDTCERPAPPPARSKRSDLIKRQVTQVSPGYTTSDDFGTDGDDTPHSRLPSFRQPNSFQANASLPVDGSEPETVDLVFIDFVATSVLNALRRLGRNNTREEVENYLHKEILSNDFLPAELVGLWWIEAASLGMERSIRAGRNLFAFFVYLGSD